MLKTILHTLFPHLKPSVASITKDFAKQAEKLRTHAAQQREAVEANTARILDLRNNSTALATEANTADVVASRIEAIIKG